MYTLYVYTCIQEYPPRKEQLAKVKAHVVRDNSNSNRDHTFVNTHMHVVI